MALKARSKELLRLVKDEISSYDRYNNNQLLALDRSVATGFVSWQASEQFTFSEWIEKIETFTVIKVEGLEDNKKLIKVLRPLNIKDIHLFNSIKTDYSFGWHHDTTDVYLFVLKGKKRISIRNKTYFLNSGEGILIPKGHKHRVFNYKDTWALSIGLK